MWCATAPTVTSILLQYRHASLVEVLNLAADSIQVHDMNLLEARRRPLMRLQKASLDAACPSTLWARSGWGTGGH